MNLTSFITSSMFDFKRILTWHSKLSLANHRSLQREYSRPREGGKLRASRAYIIVCIHYRLGCLINTHHFKFIMANPREYSRPREGGKLRASRAYIIVCVHYRLGCLINTHHFKFIMANTREYSRPRVGRKLRASRAYIINK